MLRQGRDLIGESADQDGRLEPQNNHLLGVWMPGSLTDQREGTNKELKSKGRIEREIQFEVKRSPVSQGISSFQKCVNLFYSQVGKDFQASH